MPLVVVPDLVKTQEVVDFEACCLSHLDSGNQLAVLDCSIHWAYHFAATLHFVDLGVELSRVDLVVRSEMGHFGLDFVLG